MEYALEGKNSILVTYKNGKIGYVTLDEVVGRNTKKVQLDDELLTVARDLGICFGD